MAKRKATATKGRAKAKGSKEQSLYLQLMDAAERGREWLGERSDYWGYLVRRSTPRGAPELARHLQGDLRAKQGRDGSWYEGDLYETSEGIWLASMEAGMNAGSSSRHRSMAKGSSQVRIGFIT